MTTATMKDGAKVYFKDWGAGPVVTFSHGWPLTADAWDAQMLILANHGYRVIAHDRRSHGRSDQTWTGNDMDTYADDLATLLETLDVKGATMIGHSTGGGEVARYIGRHGTSRISKAVLISAVPPYMAQTPTNPNSAPMSVFDGLRASLLADRAGFFKELAMPFFGYNRPNAKVSQGQIDSFWLQGMMGSLQGEHDCIKAFSETDFTDDLKKMTIPTLLLQGNDDQIVPIDIASRRSVKILPNASLKEYAGAPHGMCVTHADQVNADLLAFLKG
ncbi:MULTISPECIES: alpha/beta hydrolase [unclassified Bradyrhizobium]|uniref:alpha/beta fold hydrolase n=1 Tax=unclassified Bradyrhizobium TaxID=2631580 RepID=UPI001FFAF777|nr:MULTISPECIES: alpha/beta hydrolase [unclassified Bradyrhizobium]MCK1329826.1 alpha/beta hydrolase [Bradyrhizobium sp. CW9]MCK1629070.1 alpha/beta hydrolase [Bradyrhizobium sp. 162]MCK1698993.1 alpha/beta hydrolase [Bradyrhizobium sp. 144]